MIFCLKINGLSFHSISVEAGDKKPKRQRKVGSRHKWTATEIQGVRQLFAVYFKKNKTPGEKVVKPLLQVQDLPLYGLVVSHDQVILKENKNTVWIK